MNLDIFSAHPAFQMTQLSTGISVFPNRYGRINQSGLFRTKSLRSRTALIEFEEGNLTLLKSQPRDAEPDVRKGRDRKLYSVPVPHYPLIDMLMAEDVEGVRAFGSMTELETISARLAEKSEDMSSSHQQTWEWLKLGAIKGVVLDGDASTEIIDIFDTFGITKKVVYFNLSADTAGEVIAAVMELKRHVEENLKGEVMSGIQVLTSADFFDDLVAHTDVEKAYERWQESEFFRGDFRSGFTFKGVTFAEYNGTISKHGGGTTKLIADDKAHAVPLGTRDVFHEYMAPASMMGSVNTDALPIYMSQEPLKHDKGLELYTESNHLPICTRPALLVECDAGSE